MVSQSPIKAEDRAVMAKTAPESGAAPELLFVPQCELFRRSPNTPRVNTNSTRPVMPGIAARQPDASPPERPNAVMRHGSGLRT
jgi:hypothetical protein